MVPGRGCVAPGGSLCGNIFYHYTSYDIYTYRKYPCMITHHYIHKYMSTYTCILYHKYCTQNIFIYKYNCICMYHVHHISYHISYKKNILYLHKHTHTHPNLCLLATPQQEAFQELEADGLGECPESWEEATQEKTVLGRRVINNGDSHPLVGQRCRGVPHFNPPFLG